MTFAWVLYHKYPDGSSVTIRRVYLDKQRAVDDHKLVSSDLSGGSCWHLDEVPIYGSGHTGTKVT